MASRFYFPSVGASIGTLTPRADWEQSRAGAIYRLATASKLPSATLTDLTSLFGSTSTGQTFWQGWRTQQIAAQTLSGTISMVIRCLEAGATEDAHLAFMLRLMVGTSNTERALLASNMTTSTEFATSAQTRILSGIALTSTDSVDGDTLLFELGVHGVTPANAANITLRIGGTNSDADFALTSGLTTDLAPWWELSQDITFYTPPADVSLPPFQRRWRYLNRRRVP